MSPSRMQAGPLATGTTPARSASRAGRFWIGVVFALISLNFVIVGVTVYAARASRTPVEHDYYRRAMNWDESARQTAMNRSLGWTSVPSLTRGADDAPVLSIRLTDSTARPIRTADVACELFHEADPGRVLRLALTGGENGEYTAPAMIDRGGLWRCNLTCEASSMRFTSTHQIEVLEQTSSNGEKR